MNQNELLSALSDKFKAERDRLGDKIPYVAVQGSYQKDWREMLDWWTNGFWPGILWQMYVLSGDEAYRAPAERIEAAFDGLLDEYLQLHHDIGFMFLHTAVADYRITGNEKSRVRGLHAANLLAGRFNPAGNFIRAWNEDKPGWIIIDCLMNLPLLYWASEETGDPRFRQIAMRHTNTALKALLREDGSCYHVAVMDTESGAVLEHPAGQGYAENSSWSRGLSWAIYGFALAYRYTKKMEYLNAAKRAAHFFIANVSLTGFVSLLDFRAPAEPVYWDTTASACTACGLLELAEHVPKLEQPMYRQAAARLMDALTEKHCCWSCEQDGLLQDGSVAYGEEAHVSLIYGDYFYLEAALRMQGKAVHLW